MISALRHSLLAMVAAALWLLPTYGQAADRLVLSSGMHEPWTDAQGTGFTNIFVAELFARIGLSAEVTFNPAAARALQLANEGTDDGLAARIAGLESQYPNLVRVPEPIFINDFVAAGLEAGPRVRKWDDLRPLSVAYILGWQVFEHNMPPVRELTVTKDSRQLLNLLRSGRVEVILHERWQVLWQAAKANVSLTVDEPPLVSTPMYIYLHKRHAGLVPRVAQELARMKAEGRHQAIMAEKFSRKQ